jgi:starch synthase (maltosyl-transferring)
MYAGFELFEHVAVKPGSEEYLDSEKYEYRPRDWATLEKTGATLTPFITKLNHIRRNHRAFQELRNITFHQIDSDAMLCFSKRTGDDVVLVVLTLDPAVAREANLHLNMPALGLDWQDKFTVSDELANNEWVWQEHNFVRLDPHEQCAHIFRVRKEH